MDDDASKDEPEDEPDGEEDEEDDKPAVKPPPKIDLKNIKILPFSGSVEPGEFDTGARDWWEEFEEQVADAQAFAHQRWSDAIKKAAMKLFLIGMASKWYRRWRKDNPAATFEEAGDALQTEFRPCLLGVDIADKIKNEKKRWSETYREYADRLLRMADAMEGGNDIASNARHALVAFARNAYPRYCDFVESKLEMRHHDPKEQLFRAVAILSEKSGTDGRLQEKRKAPPSAPTQQKSDRTPQRAHGKKQLQRKPFAKPNKDDKTDKTPRANKKRAAEAHAATTIERKRPKKTNITRKNDNKDLTCFECGQPGHTAVYCRQFLKGKGFPKTDEGEANNAHADEGSDDEE
ncbi:hypothetical protein P43SY_004478 [Pythium insidiosum]|uniref:CCHC-type domain-containing protein n=1 Tax=Pythium insidiosum TaxID=114742 RepID=A0AAD5Q5D2_PYTIN|nr:hypothetical protein P43SY_004478 [Pythium insidiosum]